MTDLIEILFINIDELSPHSQLTAGAAPRCGVAPRCTLLTKDMPEGYNIFNLSVFLHNKIKD